MPRVVAGLIVLTEQIGGAWLGRIEAQELGPLLALGKIGEIAALEPVGLGGVPVLADEAGHIVVVCRPGTERKLVVIQIGQQWIVDQACPKLAEFDLIIGTHGLMGLAIERLLHGLREGRSQQPRHPERRQDDSLHDFHEWHSPLEGITTAKVRW